MNIAEENFYQTLFEYAINRIQSKLEIKFINCKHL